jgi:hypothetical protein
MIYPAKMQSKLNANKALIFRIVHRDNVPWTLASGLYSRNAEVQDPNYRTIGNPELIAKRQTRNILISPGGTLSDYIPFYFTPFSPMMYNIKTGRGVSHVPNRDIAILVSSLHKMKDSGVSFVFSDRHAYLQQAVYYNNIDNLDVIDWAILQRKDFRRDPDDPEKIERYQAEALIYNHLPVGSLIGIVCYTDLVSTQFQNLVAEKGLNLKVVNQSGWYF